jgi:hypothetical protein
VDTREFLGRIWSPAGWHCLASIKDGRVRHYWYSDIESAVLASEKFIKAGLTIYHGCADFIEKGSRKQDNIAGVKSLWVDIDVGTEASKYALQSDAVVALRSFVQKHNLPIPLIINSGWGIHAYFVFRKAMTPEYALPIAKTFKILAAQEGFRIDPTRTADLASIMRPVGSINYKGTPARYVTMLVDGGNHDFDRLANAVLASGVRAPSVATKSHEPSANAILMPYVNVAADADKIADKCKQMFVIRHTKGNVPEPLWYAGIELLYHCKQGVRLSHEWSKGHPQYSESETHKKIEQVKALGPTTCATFEGRNPIGCLGCAFRGKITSPIQLGTEREELKSSPPADIELVPQSVASAPKLESDVFIPPPRPFKRTADGVVMLNEDGIETLIYPYDLYLHEIAYDPIERYEIATIRHWLPQEGWKEFSFRSADVSSEKDFEKSMRDNHVKPYSVRGMRTYLTMYMIALQHAKKMRLLHSSLGWKNGGTSFVLGRKEFFEDGSERNIGTARSVATVVDGICTRGSIEAWVNATRIFDGEGMEAHAFLFGCGAAAPLMKFTGYECALVNAVGMSNSGKTSMARMFMSMYGDFNLLKLRQGDTVNAKIARLGLMGSLPVYIDEITNQDPGELSDMVYEITQGRSKLRLRVDGTERETYLWNTLVMSTSNTGILNKLSSNKANPEAERLRVFEFRIDRVAAFEAGAATQFFRTISQNFGIPGVIFIKYIVTHQERVRKLVDAATLFLQNSENTLPEERMRVAVVAAVVTGLSLMKELGLIAFEERRIGQWALAQIKRMRIFDKSYRSDPYGIFGGYINETTPQRILIQGMSRDTPKPKFIVVRHPIGGLLSRYEIDTHQLWVDLRDFRIWCAKRQADPDEILQTLNREGVVTGVMRKSLGAGSDLATTPVMVFEVNMGHANLGEVRAHVASREADLKSQVTQ